MDVFESRDIRPMLIFEMKEAFDSPDYIYEIKWDGIRGVAYLADNETDLRNKRNKLMMSGFPDFYEVQKRSLMSNASKIDFARKRYSASSIAYDILYVNKEIVSLPVIERKKVRRNRGQEEKQFILARKRSFFVLYPIKKSSFYLLYRIGATLSFYLLDIILCDILNVVLPCWFWKYTIKKLH